MPDAKLKRTFFAAVLLGAGAVLAMAATDRGRAHTQVRALPLANGVWVAEQIGPSQLARLKEQGFHAVVDLRPDGEAQGQPSAGAIGIAASDQGMAFDYIPVPHGNIPPGAVDTLGQVLARGDRPLLLYCRSGRRAARTWALAEASQPRGLDAAGIVKAVKDAGQDAGDLAGQIAGRIAARPAIR